MVIPHGSLGKTMASAKVLACLRMPDTQSSAPRTPAVHAASTQGHPITTPAHVPFDLAASAVAEMAHDGFDLSPVLGAAEQLTAILAANPVPCPGALDLRDLPWSSIDNDTSRDLDQIEWASAKDGAETGTRGDPNGPILVRIAIADVAATVAKDTPIDRFAARQTQTVYTAAHNFPMLPVELSTGFTSLNPDEDRNALVAEFTVAPDGSLSDQRIFAAQVRNTAQLTYRNIGALLDAAGKDASAINTLTDIESSSLPVNHTLTGIEMISEGLRTQLVLQQQAAQRIRKNREAAGALDFHRAEATPVVADGKVMSLESTLHNTAMDLIEDLMIAANETAALALRNAKRSALRRVVRSPERWSRIADLLKPMGYDLPAQPDSGALNRALTVQRAKDPDHYPDLALAVIKLMGAGEYVLVRGDDPDPPSHFALAAHDYSHSTAPNRRYADLVTQRVLHAMLNGAAAPYADDELTAIAAHCNDRDSAARKVERAMTKRAQAMAMAGSIGRHFDAIVTGAGPKGTFVRVLSPPVEGMLVHGGTGLDVGDRVRVTLAHTDAAKAFIDFTRA